VTAYQSLLDRGVPASRTVLFGESAGATLVLSALHVMRSQDMPRTGAPDVLCALSQGASAETRYLSLTGHPRR
jgi:acetyl esterase/lipase